jgi:DnaJ-class molecular chaperone
VFDNVTDSSEFYDKGNLEITLESQQNPFYMRVGNDISGTFKLSSQELQHGHRDITLPSGENYRVHFTPGQTFVKLHGKGIPFEHSDRVGDVLLHFI